jgi:hypothetical protein
MVGKLNNRDDKFYEFSPYETDYGVGICSSLCCSCNEGGSTVYRLFREEKTREQIGKVIEWENRAWTSLLRICGFILHFLSYYLTLYPVILIIGMIPFFGAIGTTLLTLFAFIFSLMSFLIVIGLAWFYARPSLGFLFFAVVVVLFYTLKLIKQTVDLNNDNEENSNNNFLK